MKRFAPALLTLLAACQCAQPNTSLLYLCEADGGCPSGLSCAASGENAGYCVAADGGPGGGGGSGGGGGGIGGGAGGGDGGTCRTCADATRDCEEIDDGCGHVLRCDRCPGASFCSATQTCITQLCSNNGWCWENPFPQGNNLNDAWAAATDDVWVAAERGTILRWGGKGWALYDLGVNENINAIHGNRRDNVYAVGDGATIFHWDGVRWTRETPPVGSSLWGVWVSPAGTVYATGSRTVLKKPPGGTWAREPMPNDDLEFQDVVGVSDSDMWVVSEYEAAHFADGGWSAQMLPLGTNQRIWHAWTPGDGTVFAAGPAGVLAYFDGASWSVSTPFAADEVWHLWGTSANDVWVGGPNGVWHRAAGSSWVRVPIPASASYRGGVSVDAGVAFLIGAQGRWAEATPAGERFTTWSDTIYSAYSLFALDGDRVVAGGQTGGNQSTWYQRTLDAGVPRWVRYDCGVTFTEPMSTVWGNSAGELFAGTGTGSTRVIRFNWGQNGACTSIASPPSARVWGEDNGPVVFAGRGSSYLPTSSATTAQPLALDAGTAVMTALWGANGTYWTTTGPSVAFRLDGVASGAWTVHSGTTRTIRAMHGTSDALWAVGDNGTVLRMANPSASATFAAQGFPNTDALRGVWVGGPDRVWIINGVGNAWSYSTAAGYTQVRTPLNATAAVYGLADGGVWVLGAGQYENSILWHP